MGDQVAAAVARVGLGERHSPADAECAACIDDYVAEGIWFARRL